MKLKSEYYNSIKKLPVCLWFDINETGDVLLLGKKSRLRVFMESFKFKPLLIWSDKLKIGWNNEMVKNWDVIYNEWLAKYQQKNKKGN